MYICICKAVTESQICEAIRSGACTRKEITDCLNVGTACGKCNREIRDLLRLARSESGGIPRVRAGEAAGYGSRASGGQELRL
ncbi:MULTISPECIES: (2Fe-2S)-binding protein [unclassified Methylocaldum]|jgi:bacterioferritin-associated ferredoxin|uniref:(2Fe-2S)-binding protein n=1 Tax=unclassified Methylocaldum TaxID=2622260 RepID=UPI00098ACD33|nr:MULTISPECIES: (2Fe-2S)-binding protein [unclassified Methylocaldum]MBP1148591.1 bacterioferritin-associated ferredoxin [Methylocaldum sp. RMAD-M]MDV3241708.1 (2Fe-2S)-binding protein [Methylocaldum sp.]